MKLINFLLVIAALILVSNTGFSQTYRVNWFGNLDSELKSENPALRLSESQKEQIIALQTQRMEEISAFSKTNSNKEEVKAKSIELDKAVNYKIRNDILTEEQAKAQKVYRKKMRGTKGKGAAKANRKKTKDPAVAMTMAETDEIYASASDKQKARAEKATEKLNVKISASDSSLALSDDQRRQITALNLKPMFEAAKMKKEGLSKDEIKVKNKEFVKSNKRLIKRILTKEQKNAQKKKK